MFFKNFFLTLPPKGDDMDKINVSNERINSELAIFLFKEDDNFIAYSPALDLSGYGETEEAARNSFNIVLKEYFDYAISEGTLYEDLKSHGWTFKKHEIETPKISMLILKNDELSNILDKKDFKKYHEPIRVPALA